MSAKDQSKFLSQVDGFIPVIDVLAQELGLMTAVVYGIVWRYCQMENKVCTASLETIAEHANINRKTVERHIKKLCEHGYLEDRTPSVKHTSHIYADTGKAKIIGLVSARVGKAESPTSERGKTESLTGETESPTKSDRESYPGKTESTTKRVFQETPQEREEERGGGASLPPACADSRDPTDLPSVDAQLPHLFPEMGRQDSYGIDQLKRSGWNIRDPDHFQAMACFLDASRLPVPFDKSARKDWIGKVSEHLKIYGLEALRELYPLVIAHMRGDGLTVSRPGSVTNNLASYWAERKNGGKDGPHRRVRPRDEKQGDNRGSTLTQRQREQLGIP
jgi:predicted transcriptional regulator